MGQRARGSEHQRYTRKQWARLAWEAAIDQAVKKPDRATIALESIARSLEYIINNGIAIAAGGI